MRSHVDALEQRRLLAGDILFLRGADRSGGFLEVSTFGPASRTEQLSDINNTSTAARNHGWGQFAAHLRDAGYTVEQRIEPLEANAPSGQTQGRPIDLAAIDLSRYEAIVFGSNNAEYSTASVDAVETYVRNGGGVLFISDANFGSDWRDAPRSDQAFLSRFGLVVNQDTGTYVIERSAGDLLQPNHPLFRNVDRLDGEGVSPFTVAQTLPPGVTLLRLAKAEGTIVNNDGTSSSNQYRGTSRGVGDRDASIVAGRLGSGRFVGHFDRNTFFNDNGAGTDITRYNNRTYATNLFRYLTDRFAPAVKTTDFVQAAPSELRMVFDDALNGSLTRGDVKLRDRVSGELLPRDKWSMAVTEGEEETELLVRVRGAAPAGRYRLEIAPRRIEDDAGNVRNARVRFNFTIEAAEGLRARGLQAPELDATGADRDRLARQVLD